MPTGSTHATKFPSVAQMFCEGRRAGFVERPSMPTLVIHAPHSEVLQNQKQSFTQTVETQIGDGYAINLGLFQQLSLGDDVIVICKTHKKQAVGKIKDLIPTVKTGSGMQRYDVVMRDVKLSQFTSSGIKLNRNGVAVII